MSSVFAVQAISIVVSMLARLPEGPERLDPTRIRSYDVDT